MIFRMFLIVTLSIGIIGSNLLLAQQVPTYYIYKDQRVYFQIQPDVLAIRHKIQKSRTQRLTELAATGVKAISSQPLSINRWNLINLEPSFQDAAEADAQIKKAINSQDVEFVSPVFQSANGSTVMLTPDILVKFNYKYASKTRLLLQQITPDLSVSAENFGGITGAYKLKSNSRNGFEVLARANKLVEDGYAEWAEPDMIFSGKYESTPNDPLYPKLWGIHNTGQFGGTPGADMKGDLAWNITTGDTSVKVMVIDCGVQQDHPDIHQIPGIDFTGQGGGGGPVNSCDNHGTAVAGCITATINNALGVVGIAPNCYVIAARTLISNPTCDNTYTSQISWTINALTYAAANGIRITNFSNQFWVISSALEAAYQQTHDSSGIIHFAAAGNGSTSLYYPALIPVVNAVAALNSKGKLASFSNFGKGIDFSAPGDSIYTTDRTGTDGYTSGDYVLYRGTSFASPYAAGIAALILSRFPYFTATQVEQKMQNSCVDLGTPGYDTMFGWGFVNAYNAVRSSCILTPPSNITVNISPTQCGTPVFFPFPSVSGNCGPVNCNPPSGSFFTVGTTTVVCTDTSGDQCTFTVTVNGGGYTPASLRDDFNRTNSSLPGSNKWALIQNQSGGGSMSIMNNAVQAYSGSGNYNFGGVVWDSLMSGGTEASVTVSQKSGNYNYTSLFIYARMNNKDNNTGNGYRLRYFEQSGTDIFEIHRVGPGYSASSVIASASYEVNPSDVITFRVLCDNQTMVGLVNGIPIISAKDTTYNPSQWYFALRGCVFPTPFRLDNFSISPQPLNSPSSPTLLSPSNNAANQPITPTVSWSPVSGATTYRLQFSTDSLFGTTILDDSTIITSSRQLGVLSNSTKYYWRVNAKNNVGTSVFSSVWNFTTIPTPPLPPGLVLPTNGANNQLTTLMLNWSSSSTAISYRVQVSIDSLFGITILDDSTITGTTRQVSSLLNNTKYYWHVSASNPGGTSSYSTVWNFTTIPGVPIPPSAPTLVAPLNGATNQPTSMILNWAPSSGALSYRVQISIDSLLGTTVLDDSTVTTTSRLVGSLANNTTYYWHVSAKNSNGSSLYSAVWKFTTIIAPPAPPILSSPIAGSLAQPITLSLIWNPSTTATSYCIQISTDSLFATTVINDSTIAGTTKQVGSLSVNTKYYWRVNAKNIGGTSAYSSVWNFTTLLPLPSTSSLQSPLNGATCQPTTLTLSWSTATYASTYRVQVARDSLFTTIALDDSSVTATSRQVTSLMSGVTYYWKVNAKNATGVSSYSAIWSFVTFSNATLRDDFNRANGLLPGSNKWALIQNQPNSGSMSIVNNAIQPYSSAGNYNFGGVVWDSSMSAGSEASLSIIQKSGVTYYSSLFIYAKMNNKDYNTGTGYRLRFMEQSGPDLIEIHRVGPGYGNSTVLAAINLEINPGDVFTFRVLCDNKTLVGLVNGVPVISAIDVTYMPSQWYFAVRGCILPTPGRFDNFNISSPPIASASNQPLVNNNEGVNSTRIIETFDLKQNYPNPFNPITLISYTLPTESRVNLKIYNLVGQMVKLLSNNEVQPSGYQTLEFDAGNFASGIYFYRLEAISTSEPSKTFIQVRKMVLMK